MPSTRMVSARLFEQAGILRALGGESICKGRVRRLDYRALQDWVVHPGGDFPRPIRRFRLASALRTLSRRDTLPPTGVCVLTEL